MLISLPLHRPAEALLLNAVQPGEQAAALYQFVARSFFDEPATFENRYFVRAHHGAQPVRDYYDRPALCKL